jgi:hypothetical protein
MIAAIYACTSYHKRGSSVCANRLAALVRLLEWQIDDGLNAENENRRKD